MSVPTVRMGCIGTSPDFAETRAGHSSDSPRSSLRSVGKCRQLGRPAAGREPGSTGCPAGGYRSESCEWTLLRARPGSQPGVAGQSRSLARCPPRVLAIQIARFCWPNQNPSLRRVD